MILNTTVIHMWGIVQVFVLTKLTFVVNWCEKFRSIYQIITLSINVIQKWLTLPEHISFKILFFGFRTPNFQLTITLMFSTNFLRNLTQFHCEEKKILVNMVLGKELVGKHLTFILKIFRRSAVSFLSLSDSDWGWETVSLNISEHLVMQNVQFISFYWNFN